MQAIQKGPFALNQIAKVITRAASTTAISEGRVKNDELAVLQRLSVLLVTEQSHEKEFINKSLQARTSLQARVYNFTKMSAVEDCFLLPKQSPSTLSKK